MDMQHLDSLGGLLKVDLHNGKVWVHVEEGPLAQRNMPQAHLLEADDAVALAHYLLRKALQLGDCRPEVVTALGALQNMADREEALSQ